MKVIYMTLDSLVDLNMAIVVDPTCVANTSIMDDLEAAGNNMVLSIYKRGRGATHHIGDAASVARFSREVTRASPSIPSELEIEGSIGNRRSTLGSYDHTGQWLYLELGAVLNRSHMPDQFYLYMTNVKDATLQSTIQALREKYESCTVYGYKLRTQEVL